MEFPMAFQADPSQASSSSVLTRPEYWLVGGGEMSKLIRSMDWTKTPLGPIESWPQSLRTTVSLCLASNFPISLAWGPKHVQIYNDGYWPICGGKHPHSMGQDFSECWASAWPAIGEAFERALAGETSYLENQRMFLDRNGYLEETFFTFSFSPIRDETGGVGGLFHPVTETTSRMLSERRTRLRDLAARAGKAQTMEEACTLAAQTLAEYELDLPFVLFYLFDTLRKEARLIASAGLQHGTVASPALVNLEIPQQRGWPLIEVMHTGQARHVDDLEGRFGHLSCGPYPESVKEAMALPIIPPGCEQPVGILVAGVSSRLQLNEGYRAFYDLLAAGVTTAVANARAYQEERKRAEALAEIDRAKTAFFSNVSHEFRTPLTLLLGPLEDELAERANPLPQERRERLETAHRNSLRLLKLVNTLLDFSRIEAGRVQATYEPTDLAAHTAELASVFRSAIEKAGLTLAIDCPALPEPVYVDREMWEKIVLNLLSNAFKHTFEGSIDVTLRWCDDHVKLAVADSGVGIPAEALPRLFERFHRVKGAKSRTHEGTGIGLALVQELVGLHGGNLSVASEEEKGSTFTITIKTGTAHLPSNRIGTERVLSWTATRSAAYVEEALHWLPNAVAPSEADYGSANSAGVPLLPDTSLPAGAKRSRILWADDNADMRDYVCRLLAGRYDVLPVPDGLKALAAAEADPPDLVLTDVMMPGLDGFGLLRELRKSARTKTVPVILLSARAGEESAVEGLDTGADDYLAKPFSARELLARVRTHLELARVRREWVKELEQANRELECTSRFKDQFLSTMSHELRTPLNAVLGFSALLAEERYGPLNDRQRRYVSHIHTGGQHLLTLINDILDLSRIEAGRMELAIENVSVETVFGEVLSVMRPLADNKSQTLSQHAEPGLSVRADLTRFKQVLMNLLGNGIKFTPEGGRIELTANQADGEVRVEVRDTGPGIPPEEQKRIFEAFYRLRESGKATEGTGLGLAITQRLVELHGGQLCLESQPGQGSCFHFSLPVAAAVPQGRPQKSQLPGQSEEPPRVLVIEDDPVAGQLIQTHLTASGYEVVLCNEPGRAAEMAAELQPDAITLDILMEPSGWEVLVQLKNDARTASVPIIVVTIVDQTSVGAALGADEYLVKPVGRAALLAAVDRCLAARGGAPPARPILVVEDDPPTREVITELLTEQGYAVATAADGAQARAWVAASLPELVMLDLLLPKVSGFELLAEWRASPRTADLPVFILTSKDLTREEEIRLRAHAELLLRKEQPWQQTMLNQLRRVVTQNAPETA